MRHASRVNGHYRTDLKGRYGPDVWVEFINEFVRKNRARPFFVYYSMALPHWPMVPTPRSDDWAIPAKRHPSDAKGSGDPRYFPDMVEYMDECVGKVIANIDQLGLANETLILFFSDNGTHRLITSRTDRGPVAGGKGRTTNAGTHVPLIARWKGRLEPSVHDDLVDSTDFIPTLLEAAGQPPPATARLD